MSPFVKLRLARNLVLAFACLSGCTQYSPPLPTASQQTDELAQNKWSSSELNLLQSLALQSLPPLTPTWRNPRLGDTAAELLGQALFFEPRLSRNQTFACSSCHDPSNYYQDGQKTATGLESLTRNTPSLVGVAWRQWWYWDGRKDSLWSQALEPIEANPEMGGHRLAVVSLISRDPRLNSLYNDAFGPLASPPALSTITHDDRAARHWDATTKGDRLTINKAFVNLGIAIAAFESTLTFAPTRFDLFVAEITKQGSSDQLSIREQSGLRLFISGRTDCVGCHSGPRFASDDFHNVGTRRNAKQHPDPGRSKGVERLAEDPLNCKSNLTPIDKRCDHIDRSARFEVAELANGAFRVPSLRNLVHTAPYFHDGRFSTLEQVLSHYRNPPNKSEVTHELFPLALSDREIADLNAFLTTLSP